MCDLLASQVGVSDKRGGAVEKAPGNAVQGMGKGI
jgi:hypothetical protein